MKPRVLVFKSNNNIIVLVSFTKERWTQKLSGILLNCYYYFFNWTFFGLRSGLLDFFWARV